MIYGFINQGRQRVEAGSRQPQGLVAPDTWGPPGLWALPPETASDLCHGHRRPQAWTSLLDVP